MTRARECLVLSGAVSRRQARGALLELLEQATGAELGRPDQPEISIGQVGLRQTILQTEDRPPSRVSLKPMLLKTIVTDEVLSEHWRQRDERWKVQLDIPLLVSPTNVHSSPARIVEAEPGQVRRPRPGQVVGTTIHRLLQYWDFDLDASVQLNLLNRQAPTFETEEDEAAREAIMGEVWEILSTFVLSPVYERLRRATVIGREIPFLIPWNEGRQVMEGVIDLLYRHDGELWIADYKTNMITLDQVAARVDNYREQARIYRTAVERSLGGPIAGFEFIFLRHGIAVRG
jgi:ATP-dependent helicase/nuclease subunit A